MRSHLASRLERSLSGPEVSARSYEGMLALAQRVQIGIGATALVAMWLLPGVPSQSKLTVTGLLLCVYLPWSLLVPTTGKASGALARLANMAMDLLAIGMFAIVIPETRDAVMVGFVLMVAFHAYVGGRGAGFTVTAGILLVGAVAEWHAPAADRSNAFVVVMYAAVLIGLTVLLDGLGAERRGLVRHLSRLHDALQQVSTAPSLKETLESVADTAKEAVRANFVVVLMKDATGRFEAKVNAGVRVLGEGGAGPAGLAEALDAVTTRPATTPSGLAMLTAQPVIVTDIHTDSRFGCWASVADQLGFRSMVAVPLGPSDEPGGVLNAYWSVPNAFDDDDVDLLAAYANSAGLAVARAVAFDREQQAAARLADADELKSDFVARVSHELRTPLTAINGFIATLLLHWDSIDDDSKRDLLTRASWNAGELRRMVEQVLAFSRSGEADLAVAPVECKLAAELDLLVGRMMPVVGDHRVELGVPEDLVVKADREALHHVITNLLSNASKFSPAGSTIHVTARPAEDGRMAEVSVRDEGDGIAEDELPKVFDRFYRGRSVSARGTGIGLSIVRSYVEQLGGRVWVESTPGSGATFTFTLPLAGASAGAGELVGGEDVDELATLA